MTTQLTLRVLAACDDLAADGIFPGPTALNERLHGHRSNNLNGRDTRVRTMWLERQGYVKDHRGRWVLPVPAIVDPYNGIVGDREDVHRRCGGRYLIGRTVLGSVHPPSACEGQGCPIHHPSPHHMLGWRLTWRGSGPFDIWAGFERICPHGVGHLDPDTHSFMLRSGQTPPAHGCDGCCRLPEPPVKRRSELMKRLLGRG